jgi:UDP-N-acetylmuramoylalanine--D-glutamate ligase
MNIRAENYFNSLKGKRVAVLGMGVSHKTLIPMLIDCEARLTVCDKRTEDMLDGDYISMLRSKGVILRLGNSYLDDLDHELIFKTPGMRFDLPQLVKASEQGSEVISEMGLFFDLCACPIIGVTGSDGKTTTTTLIYEMLKKEGHVCHLGGNIGTPLLPKVREMKDSDICIVELSSFQLHTMKKSPNIAVVTNAAPNHLDIHKSMEEYVDAKRNIYLYQDINDKLVLNADNEISNSFGENAKAKVYHFARVNTQGDGAFLIDDRIVMRKDGKEQDIMGISDIAIPGIHNVENYLAAIAAVWGLVSIESITAVAKEFMGVAHRIELIRELDGVKYYNDSIASSPTRTIAGLHSFGQKVILIAGGYDKKIPFDNLGVEILKHVKTLILMGNTMDKIQASVENAEGFKESGLKIVRASSFENAVEMSRRLSNCGDVVLMSPACASFDLFANFEERGNRFRELVNNF